MDVFDRLSFIEGLEAEDSALEERLQALPRETLVKFAHLAILHEHLREMFEESTADLRRFARVFIDAEPS